MAETFKQRDWRPGTDRRLAVTITLTDPDVIADTNYQTSPGATAVLYLCDAGSILTVDSDGGHNHAVGRGLLYDVDSDQKWYYPLIEDWSID